jgi:hypothetical protein
MASSGMSRRVALVRTDVSENSIASIIMVEGISVLGTLAVTSNSHSVLQFLVAANVVPSSLTLSNLIMEVILSSEMSFVTRTTRSNIPEDEILNSHRRENLKSYIALTGWTM